MDIEQPIYSMSSQEIKTKLFGDQKINSLNHDDHFKYLNLSEHLKKFPINKYKICLLNPPQIYPEYIRKDVVKNKFYTTYLPYGLLALSASIGLFNSHWNVIIKDLFLEEIKGTCNNGQVDFDSLLATIPDDCDLYGVSFMFNQTERQVLQITDYLKSKEKFVIAGGVQCTADYVHLLETDSIDIVFKKESETQINRVLNLWEESIKSYPVPSEKSKGIVNLSFKSGEKIISFEDTYETIISIDIRDEYEKINLDDYNTYGSAGVFSRTAGRGRKFANIMSNRGCRGRCTFCAVRSFMKHGVRSRATQDVIDEILFLYHNKNVRHIEWLDDDFLGNRKRALELFNKLSELNLDLTWSTTHFVLAISIDEEMAQAMVNSGCVMTGFGVETGNEKRLKKLRKPSNHKIIRNAVSIFRTNHPQVVLTSSVIFGFPNETFKELFDTFNFVRDLKLDWCINSMLQPLFGTEIYDEFLNLERDRTVDKFGKGGGTFFTIGRELVSKGYTFDDVFKDIIDFRKVDLNVAASKIEIQQFQIYFNVFVNLLGNVNLTPQGNPEKIRRHTDDILKAYPMDAVAWLVNAKASKMLGLTKQYDNSMKNHEIALKDSSFWTSFFELYDIPNHFDF
jgi:radical SAM superfamily enzyme YgiQ (UPF0313 family)